MLNWQCEVRCNQEYSPSGVLAGVRGTRLAPIVIICTLVDYISSLRTGLKFAFLWTVYADFGMEFSHDETEVAKWEGYAIQVEKMRGEKQRIKNRLEDRMTPRS